MKNVVKDIVNVQNYNKKKKFRIFKIMFLLCVLFTVILIGADFLGGIFSNSESTEELLNGNSINKMQLTTVIYDKDSNVIDEIYGLENRIHVQYENLPENLINSVVAIEDERFFEHNGIDIKRTIGAIISYIKNLGKAEYGGSTITQQLIKNVTDDDETTISRKLREWNRALSLESKYSKEYIFETYVNTVYFGEGAYGVEAAARTFFNKSVNDLSLAECATLAAAIQSPELTNPFTSDETRNLLLQRKDIVLAKMFSLDKISKEAYDIAKNETINFNRGYIGSKIKSYFVDAAIIQIIEDLVNSKKISYEEAKKQVYTGGYKIYTTMDQNVQNAINNAYNNQALFYTDSNGEFMQSAMVVIEQSTGYVVGIAGGANEKQGNFVFNRATQAKRQPGSCMKPFGAYGPAFEKELLTSSAILQDTPLTIGNWNPKNYYGYFRGNVTVRQAVALSMNLPAIRANMLVDKEYAYNFARSCGLKSLEFSDIDIAPLSLGGLTSGVTPLELAAAYATIANGGDYNEPKFYTKVLDRNDKEVLYVNYSPTRAMKKTTAAMLTMCLQDVVTYGTAAGYVKIQNIPMAGKTGNTDDDKDQWFCGYTPYYTIACWNGYDTPKEIGYRNHGTYPYTSMLLVNTVMNEIVKDKPIKEFEFTKDLVEVNICTVSNNLAKSACYNRGCVTKKMMKKEVVPSSYCTIHNLINYYQNNGGNS